MHIGELAARTGVSRDALRLYERRGLIRAVRRANGYRAFDSDAPALVRLIRQGQQLGFSLAEMADVLVHADSLDAQAAQALLDAKIADVDARIAAEREAKETSALASHTSCSACKAGAVSGLESELVGLTGNAQQELIAV
jgi:MerR family copper efflux transcriptional regulator